MTGLLNRIPPALHRTSTWGQGNGDGIIRCYVGERTDPSIYTPSDLRAIDTRINTTPRRIHGRATAQHLYDQAVAMTT